MEQVYESSDLLEASTPNVVSAGGNAALRPAQSSAPASELPGTVLPFDNKRYRRPTAALQARGARVLLRLAEFLSIVLASVAAGGAYHALVLGTAANALTQLAVGLLAAILFTTAMNAIETNQRLRRLDGPEAARDIVLVWLGSILCVTFFAFSLKAGGTLSRGSMLTFLIFGNVAILATRSIVTKIIVKHYRPGRLMAHQVIVIGADGDPTLEALRTDLSSAGYAEPCVVRFKSKCSAHEWRDELQASIARVLSIARTAENGEICIAAGGFDDKRLSEIAVALQIVPRAVRIIPAPPLEQLLHLPIRSVGSLHSVELQRAPLNVAQRFAKRALDIVLASAALVAFAPFFMFLGLAIKLTSRGPVLFRQRRLGHRGVPFSIFKFRTMTVEENAADVKQVQQNDRRVTALGRLLRKSSIDELPQLLNVLRGEMSLVGPRPHAVAHDQYYTSLIDNYDVRQHVKPGITGWAQVNGYRGETSSPDLMRRRVEFDIWYAKNASIFLDIRILLLTVVEVFRQRNAY